MLEAIDILPSFACWREGCHTFTKNVTRVMEAAGEVRDLDIAMELVAGAGIDRKAALSYRMAEARRTARRNLLHEAQLWKARGFSKKWRATLGLTA